MKSNSNPASTIFKDIANGNFAAVQAYIDQYQSLAFVNPGASQTTSLIEMATHFNQLELMQQIFDYVENGATHVQLGQDMIQMAMGTASRKGYVSVLQYLLEQKLDDDLSPWSGNDAAMDCLLKIAVKWGQSKIVEYLLGLKYEHGHFLCDPTKNNNLAICQANFNRYENTVLALYHGLKARGQLASLDKLDRGKREMIFETVSNKQSLAVDFVGLCYSFKNTQQGQNIDLKALGGLLAKQLNWFDSVTVSEIEETLQKPRNYYTSKPS